MVDRKLEDLECHMQELNIAKKEGDREREGNALGNLSNAYFDLGDLQQAIKYYKQSLSIAKEVGNRNEEGKTLGNLGVAYHSLGDFKRAIEYHEQHLCIAKEVGDREGEGKAYSHLGVAYHSLGDFKRATEYHELHLNITKEVGDRAGEGKAYGHLGSVYSHLGNLKQAIAYHKLDFRIAKEEGNRAAEGRAYGNLGSAYVGLGNFEQAMKYHKQNLSIAKEIGDRGLEGGAYGNLGSVYQSLGDFEQAIEYHKQHLTIAKEVGDRVGEGGAYGHLGSTHFGLGNFEQAVEYHKQHLSIAKEIGDRVGEGDACYSLGLAHESLASFSEALDYYQSSVRLLENTRALLQSHDSLKISFRDRHQDAYTALRRLLLKNGKTDEALYAAEQVRAQALTEALKREYGVDSLPSASAEPKKAIDGLLTTQTVFTAFDESENMISFWVLRKGEEILFKEAKIEPGTAKFLLKGTLKEIAEGVPVEFENRPMDEQGGDPLPNKEAVEVMKQPWISTTNVFRPMYDVLIGPIADLLQGDQLIVVPDGPFFLAPYSALSESIKIRIAPSLTALKLITDSPEDFHCRTGALVVGDPCLEAVTNVFGNPVWRQLPFAKKEAEMIGELLKTTPLTGRDATKDEVLKRLKSVALVHIAANACQSTGGILLAPDPGHGTSQVPTQKEYILTMSDVEQMRMRARLVVLSCSHSGCGEVKSEGVVGIARSFLCAGARSVLVSLWAIDDEATMMFMRYFYQHLAEGESASVALHQAMKSLRETEQFSAAKYWAPFVLIGDDVTLEFGEEK